MDQMWQFSASAIVLASGFAAVSGLAAADRANFCRNCETGVTVHVENNALVRVKSITVTQQKNAAKCKELKSTLYKNLAGGMGMAPGEAIRFFANAACSYEVVFKTPKSCSGTKVAHIHPDDFTSNAPAVRLLNGCGTLSTQVSAQ